VKLNGPHQTFLVTGRYVIRTHYASAKLPRAGVFDVYKYRSANFTS
jgi:hypothetical protein